MTPAVLVASVSMSEAEEIAPSEERNVARRFQVPLQITSLQAPGLRSPDLVVPVLHSFALMAVVRGVESYLWPDPFSKPEYFAARYEEAFTKPPLFDASKPAFQWDGDRLSINLIGHGLYGSEFYMRARQCRWGVVGSFFFSAATSAVWEYAFEANGVRPSAQDLVYTPVMGLALGEARYATFQLAKRIASPVARGIVQGVMDPFGEIERALGTGC